MNLLISGGLVVDGSGRPGFIGDVLVRDGLIVGIRHGAGHGQASGLSAQADRGPGQGRISPDAQIPSHPDFRHSDQTLDATGLVVAPGFIDTHSHSDLKLLEDPFVEAKIRQGITTEVLGQDGISMAPLPAQHVVAWRKNIAGLEGGSDKISWDFPDTDAYLSVLEGQGVATNSAYLAPHGNIRMEAMGLDNRPATPAELERMKAILRREMLAGACGLSTGLIYIPCAYADTHELIELCRVVAEFDGVFVTHQRSEANQILESMAETIRIGRESGVRIHFSHFKI